MGRGSMWANVVVSWALAAISCSPPGGTDSPTPEDGDDDDDQAGDGDDGDRDDDDRDDDDRDDDDRDDDDWVDPGPAEPEECSALRVEAAPSTAPADIVWVIDNSGSMEEEEERVQENLNTFAEAIEDSGVDHHVVMITDASHVTVPPPLGGSDRYLAIDREIDSHDALEQLLDTFPDWRGFLRSDAVKHFVVVSDDESDMDADEFEEAIGEIPELSGGFVFHAIVAEDPPWNWNSDCFTLAAAVGHTYIELQEEHGGVFYSLCQDDWAPVFDALSTSVVGNAQLPCSYEIPAPPDDVELDWDAVNFVYTADGQDEQVVPYVDDDGSCDDGQGWYYDDRLDPRVIFVCPATCDALQEGAGQVDVAFGCATLLL